MGWQGVAPRRNAKAMSTAPFGVVASELSRLTTDMLVTCKREKCLLRLEEMEEVKKHMYGLKCQQCRGTSWAMRFDHEDCEFCGGTGYADGIERWTCPECEHEELAERDECTSCSFNRWMDFRRNRDG